MKARQLIEVQDTTQILFNDDRVHFAIDVDGKGDFVVKYNGNEIGVVNLVSNQDKESNTAVYALSTSSPDFAGLNGRTGTLKMLKINIIRWIDMRLRKP